MKRYLLILLASSSSIFGSDCEEPCIDDMIPFYGGIEFDTLCSTGFKESDAEDQNMTFHIGKVTAGSIICYNEKHKEGLAAALSYTRTHLKWKDNPNFDKEDFNTLTISLSGFSYRLCDWEWKSNASCNIDTDYFDLNKYVTFDFLLWGRFAYCENLGVHLGFYANTGMKFDRVYPVLGIDWQCRKNFRVNAVFPIDISAIWDFNECWSVASTIHFFQTRQRVGKNEPLPRSLWIYHTYGAELGVIYNLNNYVHADLHAGYTLGGKLKLADRHYDERHHFRPDPTPYFGGKIDFSY